MFYDFTTKYIDIFVEKLREAFAMQKLITFFQQKILGIVQILMLEFNEMLTYLTNEVSFEQSDPVIWS